MDPLQPALSGSVPPPCLIAGCGYVGTRLAQRLRADRPVRALVRSASACRDLAALGIETLQADLDAEILPEPLQAAAGGACIAYLAPPAEAGAGDSRLERFVAAIAGARPRAFLYMSTTGVYGDTGGAVVTESTPAAPSSARGHRRVAAERIATAWCADHGVRCVILRVPGIYGPHRLPIERLRRGEPALRQEDAGPGNRIHVDDLVAACVAALDRSGASGVYNVGDGDQSSTTEYLVETARQAGLPAPRLVSRAEAQAQIAPAMLAFLNESRRVDTRRMCEELGVQLRYPDFRRGIAASLAEMRGSQH